MHKHDSKPNHSDETTSGFAVRRKLVFALVGGLLVLSFVYSPVAAATVKPKSNKVTEDMVLDFLRNLFSVIKHDDLADVGYIEKTLSVKAVMKNRSETDNGGRDVFYHLKEPKSLVMREDNEAPHTYWVNVPKSGGRVKANMRLHISDKSHQPGVTINDVERIFGLAEYPDLVAHIHDTTHLEYVYFWRNQNDTFAILEFDGIPGYLKSVTVFQNDEFLMNSYPH